MPEAHAGRLFDHVGIEVRDVEASRAFYAAVLEPLGLRISDTADGGFSADELFVRAGGTPTGGLHLAFQAHSPEVVDRFHAAALAAGVLTIRATTPRTLSTPTATTSRPSTTGRSSDRRRRSSFAGSRAGKTDLYSRHGPAGRDQTAVRRSESRRRGRGAGCHTTGRGRAGDLDERPGERGERRALARPRRRQARIAH